MSRFDNDRLAGNSNGHHGLHENAKPFKGIPVTLKVPTHVDVSVFETIYLDSEFRTISTSRRNLHAAADVVYSDKIFSVDPKRAAAGVSNYTMEMYSDNPDDRQRQYFKQVKQHIEDETINDINEALGGLIPLLGKKPTGSPTAGPTGEKTTVAPPVSRERVVAWKRFDVNAVDFEDQVKAFVEHHLNNCDSCCLSSSVPIENVVPMQYAEPNAVTVPYEVR